MSPKPNQTGNPRETYHPLTPTAAHKNWFSRNRKWLLTTLLLVILTLPLTLVGSIFAAMKNSMATDASTTTASPPAAQQAAAIQSQDTNAAGMVSELTECRRHEGVLTIKLRFHNTANKQVSLRLTNQNSDGDSEKFYVTAGSKKFFMLKDTEGTYLTSNSNTNGAVVNLEAGQTFLWWAKYPAPPAEVKKIDFVIPVAPPFEDVPITDK
jgi:hypothetical protein